MSSFDPASDPASQFGFLLAEVSRRYVRRFEQRARAVQLTLPTCRVLAYLERHPGISQARLAEFTALEPMAVVRLLDRLQADGLIERRPDPTDRRVHSVHLSEAAAPVLADVKRLAAQTRAEIFAGVDPAQRDVFLAVLEQLRDKLAADDPVDAASPRPPKSLSR
ncbi:transcriptional regulator SlyA [mine drainage metagenome]|uniref:Transcriptional regulator SlyA n=1 Tax=mine drainage metagenome TaxID=410659 RepID=A0A1J5QUI5_9ZZZZ